MAGNLDGLQVNVIGLGYVGLPTAALMARAGYRVIGVDIDPVVVAAVNAGRIERNEPGLGELVAGQVASGRLTAATRPDPADVFVIAVPTPVTPEKQADLSAIREAAEAIAPLLRGGNLVVLESTSPPGTTGWLAQLLYEGSGLGEDDLSVAYSPERVLPGRALTELVENDRVVGGVTPRAASQARDLFAAFVTGEIALTDAKTAELVKLMENSFRDVTIALANEFAAIATELGADPFEAIALANRHPRVAIPTPGPGVGGHCIPVDPWFLAEASPRSSALIRAARAVNDDRPAQVVAAIRNLVADVADPVIALLGIAYKGDSEDVRESPSVEIARRLTDSGVRIRVHDPFSALAIADGVTATRDLAATLKGATLAAVLTDHSRYRSLDADALRSSGFHGTTVLDTRGCLDPDRFRSGGIALHRFDVRSERGLFR